MRIPVTETTALRLGKAWDVFKKTLPFLLIVGFGVFGFWLMHNSIVKDKAAYMNKCQQLGGVLVYVAEDGYRMCIKDVQVIKEQSNVSP